MISIDPETLFAIIVIYIMGGIFAGGVASESDLELNRLEITALIIMWPVVLVLVVVWFFPKVLYKIIREL
jgi:hypothetical protein